MTAIPIVSSFTEQSNNPCPEWVLLDLQGDLSWKPQSTTQTINQSTKLNHETLDTSITQWAGLQLGQLSINQVNNQSIRLQIGNQLLEGKLVALKKPLIVMKRTRDLSNKQSDDQTMTDGGQSIDQPALHVQAVIRYRISMVTRPKPLVVSTPGPMPSID